VDGWSPAAPGILSLPSGRLVRGRGLSRPLPTGSLPQFGLYLLGAQPPLTAWPQRWVRWPDFRLPAERSDSADAFADLLGRAADERVEVACAGGRGRTGTALACIAVLDGVDPRDAVAFVRANYDTHAVETPWQARYVRRFAR
jgi:hypothetical protein